MSGHFAARLDPLNIWDRPNPAVLDPTTYGFSEADMDREYVLPFRFFCLPQSFASAGCMCNALQVLCWLLEHDRISSLILDEDRAMENNLSSEPSDRLDKHFVDWLNFMHALQYGNGGSDSHHAG